MSRPVAAFALLFFAAAPLQAQQPDATIKKIRDSKTITIAHRTDALPFSFVEGNQPAGYTIELCKRIVSSIEQQLKVQPLTVKWVAATSQNRLDLVQKRQVDMECGSTTATLSRMELVDFSSPIFVDTTGLLARKAANAKSLSELGGKKIAVVTGTTNEKALANALKKQLVSATVVQVKNRDDGIAQLEKGTVDAFAGDKVLLLGLARKVKDVSAYTLLDDNLGFEPYAIALPRGDSGMRLAVNRALAQIFSSDTIVDIFRQAFGAEVQPTAPLLVMYGLGAYPE